MNNKAIKTLKPLKTKPVMPRKYLTPNKRGDRPGAKNRT